MQARLSGRWMHCAMILTVLALRPAVGAALDFPGPQPGAADATRGIAGLVLENEVLKCIWHVGDGRLRPGRLTDKLTGTTIEFDRQASECFEIVLGADKRIKASQMKLVGQPKIEILEPEPGAANLARRHPGMQFVVKLVSPDGNLEVQWRAVLRDGSSYIRPVVVLQAKREPVHVDELVLVDLAVPGRCGAKVMGSVPGSPVVMGNFYFAYEHANAAAAVVPGTRDPNHCRIRCSLKRNATLKPGEPTVQTSAVGVVPPGQLRRGFLYYVERQRAHPYRPVLHYNSWYDVSWPGHRMHEAECLAVIECFGRELTEKRGVELQCFLWDDGWDDTKTLWRIDKKNFPRGFAPLLAAARKYHTTNGVWLSPFGGYGETKQERIAYGRKQGFETVDNKGTRFAIAGPNYYKRFLETSLYWIRENGAIHFKYDGINAAEIEEADAMFRLIGQLRKVQPDLFVNMTTGSWPSPFYLWLGDSTWRGGSDMGFAGPGSKRQQWITYRDMETYRGVVLRGPLYPINSLMTQGIVNAKLGTAAKLKTVPEDFRDEVHSFFASGTCTQELYITPQKMTARNWDDLAEGAKWSQANADVLVDTHWIGGDPGKGQIYGWASWSPRKGILALRNPGQKPGSIPIDIARAFELPHGTANRYTLNSPWKDDAAKPSIVLSAGETHTFRLKPFEVLVLEGRQTQ